MASAAARPRKDSILKFGKKTRELFKVIEKTKNWKEYISPQTAEIVDTLIKTKNITKTMEIHDMKYTTVRAHLLLAAERIKEHRTDFFRYGRSEQAQELFNLMDTVSNWKDYVTEHEARLAESYRELKNFYEVGRELNVKPSNIAAALYGNTQKIGVVGKLKRVLEEQQNRA